MKKLKFFIMTAFLMVSFIPSQLKAETIKDDATTVTADVNATAASMAVADARYDTQMTRLEEIKAMDLSSLTPSEKKELREEVHVIQNEQDRHDRDRDRYDNDGPRHHRHGGVVFLGGGGVLLIILILLLL